MADIYQAIKWMDDGKKVLINGKKEFTGNNKEFFNANFTLDEQTTLIELNQWQLEWIKNKLIGKVKTNEDIIILKIINEGLEEIELLK